MPSGNATRLLLLNSDSATQVAAGWGEKEGTFINSERRIGLVKKVAKAPGHALSDFNIFKLIAHYWGCGVMFKDWTSPAAVFRQLARLTEGQPCDISGIRDYRMIDQCGGIQWPLPATRIQGDEETEPSQERRLFADGRFFHPDGKARFLFAAPEPMPEPVDRNYPFLLITGRGTSAQWHTETRTGKSAVLRKLHPAGIYVEINPGDALRLKIRDMERVWVVSRRSRLQAVAKVTPIIQPGQLFIPMHYAAVNQLTLAVFDPHSSQPAYKNCAVAVVKE